VTILSVPIHHEKRDSTVVHTEYLPVGLSDNISEATKHVNLEKNTPDLSSPSRYFLMMEAETFLKHLASLVDFYVLKLFCIFITGIAYILGNKWVIYIEHGFRHL